MFSIKKMLLSVMLIVPTTITFGQTPQLAKSWTGLYNNEQKISLFFKQNSGQLTGYSLLNGKTTNFLGTVKDDGKIVLKEQGQGNAVGTFKFQYAQGKMEGSWQASNHNVKPKFFTLTPQECRFAKNDGDFLEVSQRLLKDADLQVPLGQLQHMRNEVYARHGYAFSNKEWANRFAYYDWYMPCYNNVENRLSKIEKENIKRIKLVEPYAKDVDWGR